MGEKRTNREVRGTCANVHIRAERKEEALVGTKGKPYVWFLSTIFLWARWGRDSLAWARVVVGILNNFVYIMLETLWEVLRDSWLREGWLLLCYVHFEWPICWESCWKPYIKALERHQGTFEWLMESSYVVATLWMKTSLGLTSQNTPYWFLNKERDLHSYTIGRLGDISSLGCFLCRAVQKSPVKAW